MGLTYFGTRDKMQWIKAPTVGLDASKFGWTTQTNYINGGAYIRNSVGSHKEYALSWDLTSRDNVRTITDYADGVFGLGSIYWADPFTMDKNMLPMSWAAPFQGVSDGIILDGNAAETRPTSIATTSNTNFYPVLSAVYTVGAVTTRPNVWVPIPAGYTAWVGAHGLTGTGGVVVATPTTGPSTIGTPVNLTMLSVTTTTRFNQSFDAASGYDGVLISLGGTGTVTLAGLMVQVLPTGTTPATGGYISGQGHSGCVFSGQPTLTEYNQIYDLVGLTAKLVETYQWL